MKIINILNEKIYYDKHNVEIQCFIRDLYKMLFLSQQISTIEQLEESFNELLYDTFFIVIDEVTKDAELSELHVDFFIRAVPTLYNQLLIDARYILDSDPKINSLDEVYSTYPIFLALYVHRISHQLWKQEVNVLPYTISGYVFRMIEIDLHPGAIIGKSFFINHGIKGEL